MTRYRHFIRALAFLTACLLVSCIDGREEIWLNADGSGHADFNYSFPASAARFQGGEAGVRKMIEKALADSKELKSSSAEVKSDQDRIAVHVQVAFDSVDDVASLAPGPENPEKIPPAVEGLAGKFEIIMKGRHVDLSRTVSASKALPGSMFMPASNFADRKLVYILHLPQLPDESNATRVEDGGRTLIWDIPLAQALKQPQVIHFNVTIPIPRSWIAAVCGLVLTVLALLVFGVLKWRKRRSAITCSGVSMSAGD